MARLLWPGDHEWIYLTLEMRMGGTGARTDAERDNLAKTGEVTPMQATPDDYVLTIQRTASPNRPAVLVTR
jgi:hypothetical protein